uniref:hypothetical protein n=1 Tax=Candidatus Phytoplasma sp. AldY-WA1 TaxID=2852100 RepID=UPI002551BCAE
KKLYFSFLVCFSLLIIGLSLYYGLKKPNNNTSSPVNNIQNQETLSLLEKKLTELETDNQQKIDETEKINTQDKILSDQIRLNMDQLRDYMVKLNSLQKEITAQEQELQKESLSDNDKQILEKKIKDLRGQYAEIQTKKDQLNKETLALTEQRKALHQKKTDTHQTINKQKIVLSQLTQFKECTEEINDLT